MTNNLPQSSTSDTNKRSTAISLQINITALTTHRASDPLSHLLGTDMALGVRENIRRPHLSLRTRKGLRCLLLRDPKWCSS